MTLDASLEPAPVSAPPRRARWLLALVLLIVFVSGGIVGGGSTDYMHRRGWTHLMHRPSEVPDRLVSMLRGKLELNEEQTGKVDQIVRERHREIEKLRAEVQPRIDREIEQMQSEIDAVLEPGQKDRWHEWVQSLRHRWGPDHHPRHHGPRTSHGRDGESGWSERHSDRFKSKDARAAQDSSVNVQDSSPSVTEKPADGTASGAKPADDKPLNEVKPVDAKATDEKPTADAAPVRDAPAEPEKSATPAEPTALPAKTDP